MTNIGNIKYIFNSSREQYTNDSVIWKLREFNMPAGEYTQP